MMGREIKKHYEQEQQKYFQLSYQNSELQKYFTILSKNINEITEIRELISIQEKILEVNKLAKELCDKYEFETEEL